MAGKPDIFPYDSRRSIEKLISAGLNKKVNLTGDNVSDAEAFRLNIDAASQDDIDAALLLADDAVAAAEAAQLAAEEAYALAGLTREYYPDARAVVPATVADGEYYWTDHATDANLYSYFQNVAGVATELSPVRTWPRSLAFMSGGNLGDISTKRTDGASDVKWADRSDLSQQPRTTIDAAVSANYHPVTSDYTSPSTRMTASVVGGKRRFTSVLATTILMAGFTSTRATVGNVVVIKPKIISSGATVANQGLMALGVVFSGTAPTLGSAITVAPADTVFAGVRMNGNMTITDRSTTTNTTGASVSGGSATPYLIGSDLKFIVTPLTSTSSSIAVYVGGILGQTPTVINYPANSYIGFGSRSTFTPGDVMEFEVVEVNARSADLDKVIHISPAASSGGNGSASNPFDLADAIASYDIDRHRRKLQLIFKPGLIRGSLKLNSSLYSGGIDIRSTTGERVIIDASTPMGVVWTETIYPGLYSCTSPAYLDNNVTYGGPIEVTNGVTQYFGNPNGGGYTAEGTRLGYRYAADTPIDQIVVEGSYCRHTTGTHAGKLFMRWYGNEDPNDLTFNWSQYARCLDVSTANESEWNPSKLTASNLHLIGGFVDCFRANRLEVDITSILCEAPCVGSPFEFNHTFGKVYGCEAVASCSDGFHGGATGLASNTLLKLYFFDCWAKGQINVLGIFGDGYSNHSPDGQKWIILGGGSIGAGKDGISTLGQCVADNVQLLGAASQGFSIAASLPEPTLSHTARLTNSVLQDNKVSGVTVNMGIGATNRSIVLDMMNNRFTNNTDKSVWIFNGGVGCVAQIISDNNRYTGTVPTGGDIVNQDGTFTELLSRARVGS